jgi:DNA-binding transcriptional LysR family regulator
MNLLDAMRYLAALDQHRHFGRAASACHITQPALSNALRALEAELGVAIVRRGRSYEGLTPEGQRVLETAHRMLREHEVLRQDLHSGVDAPRGNLCIGAVPTAIPVASRFAARLQARQPGILPVVRSLTSAEIESGLDNLSLDIGLGYTERMSRRQGRLEAVPQYTERYYLLRRAGPVDAARGLTIAAPATWREAAGHPLCLLTPDMHNRSIVDAAFRSAGVEIRPAIETNAIVTVVLGVLDGEVSAVVPGSLMTLERGYGELVAQPRVEPDVRTPIGFMVATTVRPARALEAALRLARDPSWLRDATGLGAPEPPAADAARDPGAPSAASASASRSPA